MIDSKTITSIYDASFSQNCWCEALDACARTMDAKGAMLYEFANLSEVEYRLEATNTIFLTIADQLSEYNKLVAEGKGSNYDQEGLVAAHQKEIYCGMHDSEVWVLDDAYFKRPEVAIGEKALNVRRRIVLNLSDDPNTYRGAIFLYGREFDAKLPMHAKESGRELGPHLAKAVELNRLTIRLRRRYNAALSVLNKIETGIFIVIKGCEVILKNRVGMNVIAADDGLSIGKDNRLSCHASKVNRELSNAINRTCLTATGQLGESGYFIEVPRRGEDSPLLVIISPLRDAEMELEKNLTGALVTVIDPLKPVNVQTDIIARAYGLTGAERRLSGYIVTGQTNKEIAGRLNVSPETVKSQLSSIFAKCGCRNRLAFVWRMFQFAPPIL